jgi:hypothetical protein
MTPFFSCPDEAEAVVYFIVVYLKDKGFLSPLTRILWISNY